MKWLVASVLALCAVASAQLSGGSDTTLSGGSAVLAGSGSAGVVAALAIPARP